MARILLQDHAQARKSRDTRGQVWRLKDAALVEEVFKFIRGEGMLFDGVEGRVLWKVRSSVSVAGSGWGLIERTE